MISEFFLDVLLVPRIPQRDEEPRPAKGSRLYVDLPPPPGLTEPDKDRDGNGDGYGESEISGLWGRSSHYSDKNFWSV